MLIPHGTIIAIADGARLDLFRNEGRETTLSLAPLPTPELDVHSKDAGKRHREAAANPDERTVEEGAFAAAVVAWLNHQAVTDQFSDVIIIAAPRTLGEMRRTYHVKLKEKLLGELAKEFTGQPIPVIEQELKAARAD
jgi:protein required for attachment to host cells